MSRLATSGPCPTQPKPGSSPMSPVFRDRLHSSQQGPFDLLTPKSRQGKCEENRRRDAGERTDMIPFGPFINVSRPEILSFRG